MVREDELRRLGYEAQDIYCSNERPRFESKVEEDK
jgi:hypothetical protein